MVVEATVVGGHGEENAAKSKPFGARIAFHGGVAGLRLRP